MRRAPLPVVGSVILISLCIAVFAGCGKKSVTDDSEGLTVTDLTGNDIGVVVFDASDSIVLLGRLFFDSIDETTVQGRWRLETWGDQKRFPTLPVNTGEGFPTTDYI